MRKLNLLQQILKEMGSVLVAYSGGVDSTVVLKVARDRLGANAVGVIAVSPTLPALELDLARTVCRAIGARLIEHRTDQLRDHEFTKNTGTRCYRCKTDLYSALVPLARRLGLAWVANGVQMDDFGDDRPGIQAAREHHVRSPLVEAEMNKTDVRLAAKFMGLSNWNKPAAACLSSRIARGLPITRENLRRVEVAEAMLIEAGFRQVRVRDNDGAARVEVGQDELERLFEATMQARVTGTLNGLGFHSVSLDRKGYRQGSANKKF